MQPFRILWNSPYHLYLGAPREEALHHQQQNTDLGHSQSHQPRENRPLSALKVSAEVAALLVPGLDDYEEVQAEGKDNNLAGLDPNYIPGVDLEPRRKPATISPSSPCFIYELDEKEIQEDIEAISKAIRVSKISNRNATGPLKLIDS